MSKQPFRSGLHLERPSDGTTPTWLTGTLLYKIPLSTSRPVGGGCIFSTSWIRAAAVAADGWGRRHGCVMAAEGEELPEAKLMPEVSWDHEELRVQNCGDHTISRSPRSDRALRASVWLLSF